jgi:curved DNA-binding protein CbpA
MEKNKIPSSDNKNLYEILEIPIYSPSHIIKKSFKKLALKYHPDKNTSNTSDTSNNFIRIKHAYDILSDENLKKEYDEQIKFVNVLNYKFTDDIDLRLFLKSFIETTDLNKISIILLKKHYKKKIEDETEINILNLTNVDNFNPIDILYNLIISIPWLLR